MTRRGWRGIERRTGMGLVLLGLFWLGAAVPAVYGAVQLVRARTTADRLGPAVDNAVVELQQERRLSIAYLAAGDEVALTAQRGRTDRARTELDRAAQGRLLTADAGRSVAEMRRRLAGLGALRSWVDSRRAGRGDVLAGYTGMIDAGIGAPWPRAGLGLVAAARARESLAEQDALLRATLPTPAGVTPAERAQVGALAGARDARLSDAPDPYRQLTGDERYQRLTAVEQRLLLGAAPAVTPAEWAAAADPVNAELRAAEVAGARDATAATPGAVATIVYAGLVAGVGLVLLIGVLVLARRSATSAGGPARSGPAEPADPGGTGAGLSSLLLDLHRRSQRLVHRQLRLLDAMQRRQADDETLGDLFRADHLATRVRRNVEKAITLAGGVPGRRWRRPVSLVEVARGAAAEIADYVRVSTSQVQPAGLAGAAVTDVTHLLAELVDNAATYSSADTRVRVTGEWTSDGGYTVVVADAGPGMTDLDLATAQQVMSDAEPPGGGVWWGFYAVGRFAARHGIAVRLDHHPAGGMIAEVRLPAELVTDPGEAGPAPGGPPAGRMERMRVRLGEMSDATTTSVDIPVAGIHGTH